MRPPEVCRMREARGRRYLFGFVHGRKAASALVLFTRPSQARNRMQIRSQPPQRSGTTGTRDVLLCTLLVLALAVSYSITTTYSGTNARAVHIQLHVEPRRCKGEPPHTSSSTSLCGACAPFFTWSSMLFVLRSSTCHWQNVASAVD